jgi:pilus assembly protein Flp/PilA
MAHHIQKFLADESGATAIEYALIASLISLTVISFARIVATNLNGTFGNVSANIT